MTRAQLKKLENQLAEIGVGLERNADGLLDLHSRSAGAGFLFGGAEPPRILLRRGATAYQGFHELNHARQYAAIGEEAYIALGTLERESHVFRVVWKNRWRFSTREIAGAVDYMRDLMLVYGKGPIGTPGQFRGLVRKGLGL